MFALSIVTRAKKVLNGQHQSFNIYKSNIYQYSRYQKKTKKPWPGTRDKNISNHGPEEKEKSFLGKKERKDQPHPTP